MKTSVYNRHWATGGGAEKYGGVIAQVLSVDGPLDLLTHDPVDVDWLAERLHLDLSRVDVRVVADEPGAVTKASADYDLFVNVSYRSVDPAATPASLYVVHFPSPLDVQRNRLGALVSRAAAPLRRRLTPVAVEWEEGFHPRDPDVGGVVWTAGSGVVRLGDSAQPQVLTVVFGPQRPASLGPTPVRVEVDGRTAAEVNHTPPRSRLDRLRPTSVTVDVPAGAREVRLLSDTFVPADVIGGSDHRRLGVPVAALRVGTGRAARLLEHVPIVLDVPASSTWTESYGAMVANSEFTQGWIRRWWDCDSEVLYPPVTMHSGAEKEPIILNAGRFFDASQGHSKKQLELVEAFRRLCDRGTNGWTLHLLGGCAGSGQSYLEQVRRAAEGYPVEIHPDAPGEELEALYRRASIYWHASGLGEDVERHPERTEHFGITIVEAMSAGAVPVVIGIAGPLETVRDGIDGFHFRDIDQLVERTATLIHDDRRRAAMSESAEVRAEHFSTASFETRLRRIVSQVPGSPR